MLNTYIISIISAILAVLGLFIEKDKPNFRILGSIFVLLVIVFCVVQIVNSQSSTTEANIAKAQREQLIILSDNTAKTSIKTSTYLTDILLSQPKILQDFGLTEERAGKDLSEVSTSELITGQILDANKAIGQILEDKPPSSRLETKLWYYNKEMDNPKIRIALEELGFSIDDKIAHQNQANDLTNAVWYGPEVSLEDYKLVILSLIRAGIDVRRTGPSCRNLGSKVNVIEIGSSDMAAGLITGIASPSKPVSLIMNAENFEEIDDFSCD